MELTMLDYKVMGLMLSVIATAFFAGRWWSRKYELPGEPVHFHGVHLHICKCGHTWQHDDRDARVGWWDEDQLNSHTCAKCGQVIYEIAAAECWK